MLNVNVNDIMEDENKQTELMTTFKMINENGSGSYSDFFDEFYPNVKRYATVYSPNGVLEIIKMSKETLPNYFKADNPHHNILRDLGMTPVKPKSFESFVAVLRNLQNGSTSLFVEEPKLLEQTNSYRVYEWYNTKFKIHNKGYWFFSMESIVKLAMVSTTPEAKEFTKNFIAYTKRCEAGMKAGIDFANASANMVNNLEEKDIYIYSLLDPEVFENYITTKVKVHALQYTNEYYKKAIEELDKVNKKLDSRRKELNKKMDDDNLTDFQYSKLELERTTIVSNIKMIDNLKFKLSQEQQKLTNKCKVNQSNQVKLLKNIIEEYKTNHNANTIYFKSESSAYDKLVKEGILENQKNGNKYTGNKIPGKNFDWMYGTVGTFQKRDKYGCQTPRFGQFGEDYLIYVMNAIDNNKPYETDLNKVEAILYGGK